MQIMVTGCAGFIGSDLCEYLLAKKHEVIGVDNFNDYYDPNVKEFNVSTGHRAIDYAAAHGTPIRSVGDGTVVFAGWSKVGYGYLTSVHHNSTYQTNYAHQSKIIVKKGQRVTQGQVIGYVGSTGFSTGPHLHYEMLKNGVKINPLKEVLPPGKPIKEENKERYSTETEKYKKILE